MTMRAGFCFFVLVATGICVGCEDSETGAAQPAPDGGVAPDGGGNGDASTGDAGSEGCAKPTSGPTNHAGAVASETWTADQGPHVVTGDVAVSGTLTIEPCAEVQIAELKSITINAGGALAAEGLEDRPIRIAAIDPQKPFAQLRGIGGASMRFRHVRIHDGGHPQGSPIDTTGTIYAQGSDQTQPTQPTLFVEHVIVSESHSNGLRLLDGAGFAPGSMDLVVTGAARYALSISPRAVGTVPSGTYTGNAVDEIVLPGGGGADSVQEDTTMHDRGVPYRVGDSTTSGNLTVEKVGGLATLTIEPGVTLRFKKGGELIVERFAGTNAASGALIAVGAALKPIVFTSAEAAPAAGDWVGITFNMTPAAADKIQHARVEYAGGLTTSGSQTCNTAPTFPTYPDAAIRVRGLPAGQFVTDTTIANSAAHGFDRGWQSDTKTDFTPTNTFTGVVACQQTYPRDQNGNCPDPLPCPQ
jgi:hypothetical protein